MKELLQFLLGIVLTIVGVMMFLQNVVVSNFTLFYRMGRVNVGGILIMLIVIAFIVFLVKPNMLTELELALVLGTLCVGVAFTIKGLLGVNRVDKEKKGK